jgi:ubiquinone/menaquinone biosynthesis C-methylase UbiE
MSWIDTLAYRISARSRAAKYAQFLDLMAPTTDDTILDVGVNDTEYSDTDNYLEKHYPHPEHITVVSHESLDHFSKRYPQVTAIIADGRALPFAEDAFIIGYSNAVIEHVGRYTDQLAFLREIIRVSQRGYITTPNRHFPIEVHTRVPLLHLLLPKRYFDAFLRFIGKDWATGDYMHLLSEQDLHGLLQEAGIPQARILRHRFLGLTLTFTVIWDKKISSQE